MPGAKFGKVGGDEESDTPGGLGCREGGVEVARVGRAREVDMVSQACGDVANIT